MADLHLDSLDIKNFRTFKHLNIERLGRVNLIVGKNGVGKTALLEALDLYANRGFLPVIVEALKRRNEIIFENTRGRVGANGEKGYQALRHLFHGRPDLLEEDLRASIGPVREKTLELEIRHTISARDEFPPPLHFVATMGDTDFSWPLHARSIEEYQSVTTGATKLDKQSCLFVTASGEITKQLSDLWDDVVLTDKEEAVLHALSLLIKIERLNFISDDRIPVVKQPRQKYPVPLRSLGEGMNRLLGVALALVNAQDGLLLIDEIESGLHYSVQPDMWRLIFETAERLKVQVFATTHSLDCLRAFESAASERGEDDSMLISLRRHREEPEKIVAVLADKNQLETIVRSHIEVR